MAITDKLLQLLNTGLSLAKLSLELLLLSDGGLEARGKDDASRGCVGGLVNLSSVHQVVNQRLHINLKPPVGTEIRITPRFMEDNLANTLLNQLVVGGPHEVVVSDAEEVLHDGEEIGLGRGLSNSVTDQLEYFSNIIKIYPNVVKSLGEFIKVLFLLILKHLELSVEFLAWILI